MGVRRSIVHIAGGLAGAPQADHGYRVLCRPAPQFFQRGEVAVEIIVARVCRLRCIDHHEARVLGREAPVLEDLDEILVRWRFVQPLQARQTRRLSPEEERIEAGADAPLAILQVDVEHVAGLAGDRSHRCAAARHRDRPVEGEPRFAAVPAAGQDSKTLADVVGDDPSHRRGGRCQDRRSGGAGGGGDVGVMLRGGVHSELAL
jgi:hypothetical protein